MWNRKDVRIWIDWSRLQLMVGGALERYLRPKNPLIGSPTLNTLACTERLFVDSRIILRTRLIATWKKSLFTQVIGTKFPTFPKNIRCFRLSIANGPRLQTKRSGRTWENLHLRWFPKILGMVGLRYSGILRPLLWGL